MPVPTGIAFGIAAALLIAATVGVTLAVTDDDDGASGTVSDSAPTPEPIPGSPKFAQSFRSCMETAGFKGVYLSRGVSPSGPETSITGKAPSGERVTVHGFETPDDARTFARLVQSKGFNDELEFIHDGEVVAIPGPFTLGTLALLEICFE